MLSQSSFNQKLPGHKLLNAKLSRYDSIFETAYELFKSIRVRYKLKVARLFPNQLPNNMVASRRQNAKCPDET